MKPGECIGKYTVLGHLASGGMGELWLAQPTDGDEPGALVVIKKMHATLVYDRNFLEMFVDEARIASQLDHPNVVDVHGLEEHDDAYFMVMEHIDGRPVTALHEEATRRGTRLPLAAAAGIVSEVCRGLHYVHTSASDDGRPRKIVHRDVAPDNILVTHSGVVKIVDFGIARAVDRVHSTRAGHVKGKRPYMSPEQFMGLSVGPKSDLYSLGVVFHELLTGRPLFPPGAAGPMQELEARKQPVAPSECAPDLPAALDAIVLRAIRYEAGDRYPSCAAFATAITSCLESEGLSLVPGQRAELMEAWFPADAQVKDGHTAPGRTAWLHSTRSGQPLDLIDRQLPFDEPTVRGAATEGAAGFTPGSVPRTQLFAPGPADLAVVAASLKAAAASQPVAPVAPTAPEPLPPAPRPARRSHLGLLVVGIALVVLAAGALLLQRASRRATVAIKATTTLVEEPTEPTSDSPGPTTAAPAQFSLSTSAPVLVSEKGVTLGRTPLRGLPLPPGRHHLHLVNTDLAIDQVLDVVLQAGEDSAQRVSFPAGSVYVRSLAPAQLFVDGKPAGPTPRRVSLAAGAHALELRGRASRSALHAKIVLRSAETLSLNCNLQASWCGHSSVFTPQKD